MNTLHRFELVWWAGCPSHGQAFEMLANALRDAGEDPAQIVRRQMITMEDAEAEGFIGSPTIRIDGVDIDPPATVLPALTCRMYFTAEGRPSPLPDVDLIASAVRRALSRRGL